MKITDNQIKTLRHDGFLIFENFLTDAERRSALDGFHRLYAPSYHQYLADGRVNRTPNQVLFPWLHSGLNHVSTHPDIIDVAERVIGTRELRLCEAHLGVKYFGDDVGDGTQAKEWFHADYGNNTLGPIQAPDEFSHLVFFYTFEDVIPGMAPILMQPNGKSQSHAVPMLAPGGSMCIYTNFTIHSASEFVTPGYRPVEWVAFCRKDRQWDGGRTFTYKSGADFSAMQKFIVEASPRQLELIGFPPVGDALWTKSFINGMKLRYEGFRSEPYILAHE